MSSLHAWGQILVQEASADGFSLHVYPDSVQAAIALLRRAIRNADDEGRQMEEIESAIAELISEERHQLDMDMATERRRTGEEP